MTEFQITKSIPQTEGIASTVKDVDVRGAYADAVEKFLEDNSSMGEQWQNKVLDLLLCPIKTPSQKGDLRGSNPYMLTFMQEHFDGLDLITLQRLRQAYEQNKNKTPFPETYIETGLALIPKKEEIFERNSNLASKLYLDFKTRKIELDEGKVPNFAQLRLSPDGENGLIFLLNRTATRDNIPNLKDYKWDYKGESGLFRAYLSGYSNWGVDGDYLEYSGEVGRVVRYDAEGVTQKKIGLCFQRDNNLKKRIDEFRKRTF